MLWVAGITQNQEKNIYELINAFGGLEHNRVGTVWVDGGSTDNTTGVITDWGGHILKRRWTNDHDFQMNVLLRDKETPIRHGDWVFIIDSQERISHKFMKKLKNGMIEEFEKGGYKTIYQRSKPIMFKYHDDQIFMGSPHWGLTNQRQPFLDISKVMPNYKDEDYVWSLRNDKEKWILNGLKYYYVYGRSNHCWLVYDPRRHNSFTQQSAPEHETMRMSFRDYCSDKLDLPRGDTKAFDAFLEKGDFPKQFIDFVEKEEILKNYFRYTILRESEKDIYDTQHDWSFTGYLNGI
jgi:hypothetical protein